MTRPVTDVANPEYEKGIQDAISVALAKANHVYRKNEVDTHAERIGIFVTMLRSELTYQQSFNPAIKEHDSDDRRNDFNALTNVFNWAKPGVIATTLKRRHHWGSKPVTTYIDPRTGEQMDMARMADIADRAREEFSFPVAFKNLENAIFEMQSAVAKQTAINLSATRVRESLAKVALDLEPELAE